MRRGAILCNCGHNIDADVPDMNARSLAEDGASRYAEGLDPGRPHAQNVADHLRDIVEGLTLRIACDDRGNDVRRPDDATSAALGRRAAARREAFLRSCSLALPGGTAEPVPSGSSSLSSSSSCRQLRADELTVRLEIYCRALRRVVRTEHDDGGAVAEPPKVVRARANFLVRSFVNTASCVRSIRPILTKLVTVLSLELLAVDAVGEALSEKIHRLVSEYEHMTSFASLAFLSSPEEAADAHLAPIIISYIQYLQSDNNYESLVADCELESMLKQSLDSNLRKIFKTAEFHSVGHLLEVCRAQKKKLQNIVLPSVTDGPDLASRCSDTNEVKQALKDLRREIITVNGNIIPPAHSKGELVRLLSETMNARTSAIIYHGDPCNSNYTVNGPLGTSGLYSSLTDDSGGVIISDSSDCGGGGESSSDEDEEQPAEELSGNEGDCEDSPEKKSSSSQQHQHKPRHRKCQDGVRRRSFDGTTVDKLTARLLIAAGRSNTGGDAYFFVRDLFGGEGVVVVPSRSQPTFATTTSSRHRRPHRAKGGPSPGTIEITVRLASITIKLHAKYDVFPDNVAVCCETSDDEGAPEPLIQLHTTTTETISLHEVRVRPVVPKAQFDDNDEMMMKASHLVLRERKTSSTGARTLSVRPAAYKKVEVWNTPS